MLNPTTLDSVTQFIQTEEAPLLQVELDHELRNSISNVFTEATREAIKLWLTPDILPLAQRLFVRLSLSEESVQKISPILFDKDTKEKIVQKSCLIEAARVHDYYLIQWLIENGTPVDQMDNNGTTALKQALTSNDAESIQILVNKGASLDQLSDRSQNFVKRLCAPKRPQTASSEQEQSQALNILDSMTSGNPIDWDLLATVPFDLANHTFEDGTTPLIRAIKNTHHELTNYVLSKLQANPNIADKSSTTPLKYATCTGDAALCHLLLEYGAQVEPQDVQVALEHNNEELFALLLQTKPQLSSLDLPLHHALLLRFHDETLRNMVELKADSQKANSVGDTPLHISLMTDREDFALNLIEKSHSNEIKNRNGLTPLMIAARSGMILATSALLEKGAQINQTCGLGCSAVIYAAQHAQLETTEILIEKGAILPELTEVRSSHRETARGLINRACRWESSIATSIRVQAEKEAVANPQSLTELTSLLRCSVTGQLMTHPRYNPYLNVYSDSSQILGQESAYLPFDHSLIIRIKNMLIEEGFIDNNGNPLKSGEDLIELQAYIDSIISHKSQAKGLAQTVIAPSGKLFALAELQKLFREQLADNDPVEEFSRSTNPRNLYVYPDFFTRKLLKFNFRKRPTPEVRREPVRPNPVRTLPNYMQPISGYRPSSRFSGPAVDSHSLAMWRRYGRR